MDSRTPILAGKLLIEDWTESREAGGVMKAISSIHQTSVIPRSHLKIIDLPPSVKTSSLKVPERTMRAGKPRRTHAVWGSSLP